MTVHIQLLRADIRKFVNSTVPAQLEFLRLMSSEACELIGLDFWEHQFDDGSVAGDNPIKRLGCPLL